MHLEALGAVELITSQSRLASAIGLMARQSSVAFDLEANGFHRYPERVCLLQVSVPGQVFLIDPLAIADLSALGGILSDPSIEKIFHSADYDVRSLDREWGLGIQGLFDTSIAAAFVGEQKLGLEAVAESMLGITLGKSKRLQRADWSIRPLNAELRKYAAQDVLHLFELRSALGARLQDLGRREWVAEECRRLSKVRFRAPDVESAFLEMKGSRGLDGKALAVLKSLHGFRDGEARRLDRPPFKVVSGAVLVELAASPGTELDSVKGIGRYARPPASRGLLRAIKDGLAGPAVKRPARAHTVGPSLSRAERARAKGRLVLLKEWRTGLGVRLGLDPALLWPAASLTRLAGRPGDLETELASPEVRAWQRREFEKELRVFLRGQT